MDWNLIWAAVGGISATLALLLTLFLEWPQIKVRFNTLSVSFRYILFGSTAIFAFLGSILLLFSLIVGIKSHDGLVLGRLGLFLGFCFLIVVMIDLISTDMKQNERSLIFWLGLISLPGLFIGVISFLKALIWG